MMQGKTGADMVDFPQYVLKSREGGFGLSSPVASFQLPKMTARIFSLSRESLSKLKKAASAFSTSDAVAALAWRHMTIARYSSIPSTETKNFRGVSGQGAAKPSETPQDDKDSRMVYAVNIRNRIKPSLPAKFLGNASSGEVTEYLKVSALLVDSGLTTASVAIRSSLNKLANPDRIALLLGLLKSRPDPSEFQFAYNEFLGPDVVTSSWVDLQIYRSDWGPLLGDVKAFRPAIPATDGTVIVLPRLRGGGLEVWVALEDGALERLIEDPEFGKYAQLWALCPALGLAVSGLGFILIVLGFGVTRFIDTIE
jgi:hypothetical protein